MTLSDLAALASEKVPGFERPWGGEGAYAQPDNSPAALAMAVLELPGHAVEKYPKRLYVSLDGGGSGCYGASHDGTTESIVRALLTALLRVYEVDVPSE